jgi:hypothetical protein
MIKQKPIGFGLTQQRLSQVALCRRMQRYPEKRKKLETIRARLNALYR